MINKRKSQIPLVTLILCLFLGSLVILPFAQVSPSALEISRIDAENYNLLEHTELEDDFFVISIVNHAIAKLSFLNSKIRILEFKSASLAPVSPPPKPL